MLVEDFRKDVLSIAKATEVAVDFDDVVTIRSSAHGYAEKLERYFAGVQKEHPNADTRPLWGLLSHLRSVPLHHYDGWSKEHRFSLFQQKSQGWVRSLRAKAVSAWKVLRDLPEGKIPKDSVVTVAGFKCLFRGYDADNRSASASYEFLEKALSEYRTKAAKTYPLLLSKALPFVVDWTWGSNLGSDVAASYENNHIILTPWVMSGRDPTKTVQMLAHEMGHHVYRVLLSDADKTFWFQAMGNHRQDVDLRDVIKVMEDEGYGYVEDLSDRHSLMYIQMSTLQYSDYPDMYSLTKIRGYLDAGNDPIIRAPSVPITGYAAKNNEEAFCEALGMSVAYGGRTVHPLVKTWLQTILGPQLRVSFNKVVKGMSRKFSPHEKSISVHKVAHAFLTHTGGCHVR